MVPLAARFGLPLRLTKKQRKKKGQKDHGQRRGSGGAKEPVVVSHLRDYSTVASGFPSALLSGADGPLAKITPGFPLDLCAVHPFQ